MADGHTQGTCSQVVPDDLLTTTVLFPLETISTAMMATLAMRRGSTCFNLKHADSML